MNNRQQIAEEEARVEREYEERKAALAAAREKSFADDVAALRARIEELAKERGMNAQAFLDTHLRNAGKAVQRVVNHDKPKRGVEPPKYMSPNDPNVTWSGKGPQPGWFRAAIDAGYTAEDMLIQTNGHAHA